MSSRVSSPKKKVTNSSLSPSSSGSESSNNPTISENVVIPSPSPKSPIKKMNGSKGDNVKVYVRVRPRTPRELELNSDILIKMLNDDKTTILHNPNPTELSSPTKNKKKAEEFDRTFVFDHSLDSIDSSKSNFKSQEDTYNLTGKDILQHTLNGYNTCIFAYGQTGSGKSFTMMGDTSNPGIIPRSCRGLFDEISTYEPNVKVTVKVSYFEIYNEQVKDLLNDGDQERILKIRENPKTGPYVEQLNEFVIVKYEDFLKYMELGNKNRTVASTKMNDQSSRSHAVFTISIRTTEFDLNQDITIEKHSSLRLVDLAGSERANSTGATGLRFKEGSNINKSLTTLGRVISALGEGNVKPPYRDSTLTWILKESLGGNSKTAMIACISPVDYDETLSTLRYATIAKKVKLNATLNVDENVNHGVDSEKLNEMKLEIEKLTSDLNEYQKQEVLINRITNMSRFFEDRLMDQTNKYQILKGGVTKVEEKNSQLEKALGNLLVNILGDKSTLTTLKELSKDYKHLSQKSNELKYEFQKDLELFAP